MSKELTIKEYLGTVYYDPSGQQIFSKDGEGDHIADMPQIIDVRGWGRLQNLFENYSEAAEFQDKVGQFIVDAINEKLETQKENM